jgi:exosortase
MSTFTIPPASQWRRWVPQKPVLVAWAMLILVVTFSYWSTIRYLVGVWWATPDYEHGFLVPMFAVFLLWLRQDMVDPWPREGTWWALPFFAVWLLARLVIFSLNYDRDADTLILFLVGLALFVGGWRALRWAWPAIVFLVFMLPLPGFLAVSLSGPLQVIAAKVSVYALQTLGIPAMTPGANATVIQFPASGHRGLDVERACSGLKMLMLFFTICVGAVFVVRKPLWEKLLILVSAVPIAVFSNVVRITVTGILSETINPDVGMWVHDHAGWFMMFVAMAMIWGEMALVSKLFVEVPEEDRLALGGVSTSLSLGGSPPAGVKRRSVT